MALRDDIDEANALLETGRAKDSTSQAPTIRPADKNVTTQAERRRAFTILFVSLTCMGAGQTVLFNILPPLSRQLGLSTIETTGIFSISALLWVFTSAYWG